MKRARILYQNQTYIATVLDGCKLQLADGKVVEQNSVTWLPPSYGNMFALGLNYADHAAELEFKPPKEPLIFIKTANTYIGHNSCTPRPFDATYMHYECELVAVIGKQANKVKRNNALNYVAGFTICNDYAIRDYLENYYRPNLQVKNRDACTPIGPYLVDCADIKDYKNLKLTTCVNGQLTQEGTTADMIFDVEFLIEYLSSFMTLSVGDMIATGTPKGLIDVKAGDEVITSIEQIGSLRNYIISEDDFLSTKNN